MREFIPVPILILSVLVFFAKIIISGDSLFGHDFIFAFYPWKKFIYDYVWSHGTLPFWNPYLFSGSPFIADIQASMFYPLGFLYYIIPPEFAYLYSTILHSCLGSIFMYLFMRSLSVSRRGAFLSAFIFTFNGYFMAHLYAGHLSFVQAYIWIPLVFYFLYRFTQTIRFYWAVSAGLTLGIQILGGFPQLSFYTILAIMGFGFYFITISFKNHPIKMVFNIGLGLIIIVCIGFGLSAVQLLPTLEFTRLSTRAGGLDYAFATYDSLNPKELLSFLIPDIFGNVVDQTYWRSQVVWHFWERCGYVGIITFFLIFFKTKDSSVKRLRLFFLILSLFSLFLALGKFNPLYPVIYKLPGFNSFRIPAQIIFLYSFGIAVMSGMGLTLWQEKAPLLTKGFVVFFTSVGIILLLLLVILHYFHYYFFSFLFENFTEGPIRHLNLDGIYGRIRSGVDKAGLLFFASALLFLMRKNRRIGQKIFGIFVISILMMDLGIFGSRSQPMNPVILY